MNKTFTRAAAATLLLGVVWGFGYFVGSDHSPSESEGSYRGVSGTPIPELAPGNSSARLSSTAIGRVIEGKSDYRRFVSLYQYADSLDAKSMTGAINEAMQLPLQYRNSALGVLFARWAELDPAAAAKYAILLPKSANPAVHRSNAVKAWAEKDFAGALEWAKSLDKKDGRNDSLTQIALVLAKTDPAGALKLIKDNLPTRETGNAYENVFATWAESDFTGAMAAVPEIADLQGRSRAMRTALNKRVDTDPRGVLEILRASTSELQSSVGRYAAERWLERDFSAAREYIMSQPPSELRDVQIRELAQAMARRDPQEALGWIDRIPDRDRNDAVQSLFDTWAGSDSKAAIEAARGMPEGKLQDTAISRVAQTIFESDQAGGLSLLKQLPSGPVRDGTVNQIAMRWSRTDPGSAADWYVANSSENERSGLYQIVGEWSRIDPDAALKWVIALPDGSGNNKGSIIGQVLSQIGRNDPASAAAQIEKLPPELMKSAVQNFVSNWSSREPEAAAKWAGNLRDEESRKNAITSVAGQWANRDPVAAAAWVATIRDDSTSSSALASVVSQWGRQDPAATASWIEKLPVGAKRDSAVSSFSYSASKADPEGAVAWAVTIQNPDMQRNTVRNVYSNWFRKDADSARSWLQSVRTISPELREELRGFTYK